MAKLPYVKEYTDNCSVHRRYFRRKGFKGGPLPGPVGSPDFMEAYQGFMSATVAASGPKVHGSGIFGYLVEVLLSVGRIREP